jgi:transcriptional regulator with XRE-family HTH domain
MSEEGLRKHPGLGSLLKSWRRQVRLTQQEVADAVSTRRGREMTPNWYAKLENRENAYPSEDDLEHILAVLGRTRWEAVQALGGESVEALQRLTDADPEPQTRESPWSDEVAAGAPYMAAPPPPAAAAPMRSLAVGHASPPRPLADDELRAALRRFGLSDRAVEEALAYARSLRARQP